MTEKKTPKAEAVGLKIWESGPVRVTSLEIDAIRDWMRGMLYASEQTGAMPNVIRGFMSAAVHDDTENIAICVIAGRRRRIENGGRPIQADIMEDDDA